MMQGFLEIPLLASLTRQVKKWGLRKGNWLPGMTCQCVAGHIQTQQLQGFHRVSAVGADCCPATSLPHIQWAWHIVKKHSWSLGQDFWGSQKDVLSALDDRYDRGTQKAILCMNLRAEPRVISQQSLSFGAIHIFFWVTVAICHLSGKKVESGGEEFFLSHGWLMFAYDMGPLSLQPASSLVAGPCGK